MSLFVPSTVANLTTTTTNGSTPNGSGGYVTGTGGANGTSAKGNSNSTPSATHASVSQRTATTPTPSVNGGVTATKPQQYPWNDDSTDDDEGKDYLTCPEHNYLI